MSIYLNNRKYLLLLWSINTIKHINNRIVSHSANVSEFPAFNITQYWVIFRGKLNQLLNFQLSFKIKFIYVNWNA